MDIRQKKNISAILCKKLLDVYLLLTLTFSSQPPFNHAIRVSKNPLENEFEVSTLADAAIFKHIGYTSASHSYVHLIFDFDIYGTYNELTTLCDETENTLPDLQQVRNEKILFHDAAFSSVEVSQAEKLFNKFLEDEVHSSGNSPVEFRVHELRRVLLDDCRNTQTNFLNVIQTISSTFDNFTETRNKRQAAMYVASFITGAVAGNIAGSSDLFSLSGLLGISNSAATNPQTIKLLSDHETRIKINERSISALNSTLSMLMTYTDHLNQNQAIHAGLSVGLAEYRRLTLGLIDTINKRLSPHLVRSSAIKKTLSQLRTQLQKNSFELKLLYLQDIFSLPTSHLLVNNTLRILVHVPVVKTDLVMNIFEFIPLPVKLHDSYIQIVTDKNILALETRRHQLYKELNKEELDSCFTHMATSYCKNANIVQTKKENSCLLAVKENVPTRIKENCNVSPFPETEKIIQLDEQNFVIYLPKRSQVHVDCEKHRYLQSHIGLVKLKLHGKCTVNLDQHSFETTPEIYTPPTNIVHEIISLDQIFSDKEAEQVMNYVHEKLSLVGSDKGLKIKNIPRLFDHTTHIVAGSVSTLSLIIFITAATIFYCYCKKNKRSSRADQEFNFTIVKQEKSAPENENMIETEEDLKESGRQSN